MKMQLIVCSIFIFISFSCNRECYTKNPDLYYIHHTDINNDDNPFPCSPAFGNLIRDVNTKWLLHGTYNCHYYNGFIQTFPERYGECVKGVDKSNIIRLLGEPNIDKDGFINYLTSQNCSKNMLRYGNLSFRYDENLKIKSVNFTLTIIKS